MTSAAIAYGSGWLGVVIADGDAPPLSLRLSCSLELGHLQQREAELVRKSRAWDQERVVTPDEVARLANEVLALLAQHGVDKLIAGVPHGVMGSHVLEVASVAEAAGIAVERVEAPETRVDGSRVLPVIEASFQGGDLRWPTGRKTEGDASCCRRAALLLLPAEETRQAAGGSWPKPTSADGSPPTLRAPEPPTRWQDGLLLPPAGSDRVVGVRTAGLDTGDRWVSLTIVEGDTLPLGLVFSDTFSIGSMQPLAKPRKRRIRDESFEFVTHHHVITRDDARECVNGILTLLRNYDVRRLRIEWFDKAHMDPKRSPQAHASTATRLAGTREIAARVEQAIEDRGIPIEVERVGRSTWAASVTGTARPEGAGKVEIEPAVRAAIHGWAPVSSEHERDSAGCAIHDVLERLKTENPPEEKEARARLPRQKAEPGAQPWEAIRKRERLEKREESGCECPKGSDGKVHRHRAACLASKPSMKRGWAETKMGEEEWRSTLDARRLAAKLWGDQSGWGEALPIWRRDAITRALTVDASFDVRTPFEPCVICMMPASSGGVPLPPTEITCRCERRAA